MISRLMFRLTMGSLIVFIGHNAIKIDELILHTNMWIWFEIGPFKLIPKSVVGHFFSTKFNVDPTCVYIYSFLFLRALNC